MQATVPDHCTKAEYTATYVQILQDRFLASLDGTAWDPTPDGFKLRLRYDPAPIVQAAAQATTTHDPLAPLLQDLSVQNTLDGWQRVAAEWAGRFEPGSSSQVRVASLTTLLDHVDRCPLWAGHEVPTWIVSASFTEIARARVTAAIADPLRLCK